MEINITQFDGGLKLSHSPPYLLKFLQYYHKEMKSIQYRRETVFVKRLLYTFDDEKQLYTLPGFFEDIKKLIHKKGDTYRVQDLRTPLPPIDWNRVKKIKLRDYQIELVADLLLKGINESGIIDAAGGVGKSYIAAILYAAWNNLNTIVAIPIAQVVKAMHKKFKELFPEKDIGMMGAGRHDIGKDITITTFDSLKNCALEKCQLLIVDEMQCAGRPTFQSCLKDMSPYRIFGLSATPDGIFNNTDKLLKGMFGEDLIYFPYVDAQEANAVVPGVVYMFHVDKDPRAREYTDMDKKIKYNIKAHDGRNTLVGKVCHSIPESWQGMLFVDHVKDHLVPLMKYLPKGTKYVHRESDKKKVGAFALTAKQQDKNIEEFANNEFKLLVATDCLRAGVDFPNCRVIIQASGGSSKVEVLQEALRGSRILTEEQRNKFGLQEKTHFVLIDFWDDHDEALNTMAKRRVEYYREQGWTIRSINDVSEIVWQDTGEKKLL